MYKVSAYWEHCIFSVLSSEADGSSDNGKRTVCDLEWKRSQWNVTKNSCDPRATFVGSYNQVRSLVCYLVGFFRPSICQRAKLLLTLHQGGHCSLPFLLVTSTLTSLATWRAFLKADESLHLPHSCLPCRIQNKSEIMISDIYASVLGCSKCQFLASLCSNKFYIDFTLKMPKKVLN